MLGAPVIFGSPPKAVPSASPHAIRVHFFLLCIARRLPVAKQIRVPINSSLIGFHVSRHWNGNLARIELWELSTATSLHAKV